MHTYLFFIFQINYFIVYELNTEIKFIIWIMNEIIYLVLFFGLLIFRLVQ